MLPDVVVLKKLTVQLGQWAYGVEHGALTQVEMVVAAVAEAAVGTVVLVAVMLLLITVVPVAVVQVKLQVIQLILYQMFQVKFQHKIVLQEHLLKQVVHITEAVQVTVDLVVVAPANMVES